MREIKFRVWDTIQKIFLYSEKADFVIYDGEARENAYGDMIGMPHWSSLEQYTGLIDKNGVEIYEGDVVEIKLKNSIIKGDIYYDDLQFKMRNDSCLQFFYKGNEKRIEVIGNTHKEEK